MCCNTTCTPPIIYSRAWSTSGVRGEVRGRLPEALPRPGDDGPFLRCAGWPPRHSRRY
ncbi:Protein of unknown function [Gryllus bimaculatus]|nr:Protein of unknown function [Gryllus bimaculatus]